ncbi:hypothetical protein B5X24_HaOG214067 [Helicoverpa armigera]|nr:hypothetical protein B5X24_HaOG214067 [Helicoverpa armigera]
MAPTRTTFSQFMTMVDYMERNGDLAKISVGSRERHLYVKKWQELTELLNSERGGRKGTEEKWKKAWSDLKNNTKRKWIKMTTGSPHNNISFTSLEHRVLAFIGVEGVTGLPTPQIPIAQNMQIAKSTMEQLQNSPKNKISYEIVEDKDWNSPSTSTDPLILKRSPQITSSPSPRSSPAPVIVPTVHHQPTLEPPPKRKRFPPPAEEVFSRCDGEDVVDYFKERERAQMELERERIRQKSVELQQKREEIQLKSQFLELMKEALKLFAKCLEEKNDE